MPDRNPTWVNICAFPYILGSNFSYMTFQPILSKFPYAVYKENFGFFLSVYPSQQEVIISISFKFLSCLSERRPAILLLRVYFL